MKLESTRLPDVKLLEPRKFGDERGFFSETFRQSLFDQLGVTFVQDNHSMSAAAGTLRGLHFQIPPKAQGKLVRVVRGAILDVAVDLRHGSATFGEHVGVELSATAWNQLYIPPGFAHGFCTLEPNSEVLYKVTSYYAPDHEQGLRYDDPALAIEWPFNDEHLMLNDRDRSFPLLADLPHYFSLDPASGGLRS